MVRVDRPSLKSFQFKMPRQAIDMNRDENDLTRVSKKNLVTQPSHGQSSEKTDDIDVTRQNWRHGVLLTGWTNGTDQSIHSSIERPLKSFRW